MVGLGAGSLVSWNVHLGLLWEDRLGLGWDLAALIGENINYIDGEDPLEVKSNTYNTYFNNCFGACLSRCSGIDYSSTTCPLDPEPSLRNQF